jgi:hypothetical protein
VLAAALSLTVILTFAGMLRQVLGLNEHDAWGGSLGRWCHSIVPSERSNGARCRRSDLQMRRPKRAIVPSSSWNMPFIG